MDTISFDGGKKEILSAFLAKEDCRVYLPALSATGLLIEGFESPLGMEALATVDWILTRMNCPAILAEIKSALGRWPGGKEAARRKSILFDDSLLSLTLKQLNSWNPVPNPA
jgi:hypothetical protein